VLAQTLSYDQTESQGSKKYSFLLIYVDLMPDLQQIDELRHPSIETFSIQNPRVK
jgi:hypothetical protein